MARRTTILSQLAERDLARIVAWTAEKFGDRQALAYLDAITSTIEELAEDDTHPRSKARGEIALGLRSLHMAKRGRPGRHLILYKETKTVVTILRVLHDSMEVSRHLPKAQE